MHALWWIALVVVALSAGAAGAACLVRAWRRHRAHLLDIQHRLAGSEESRLQLEQHAEAVDARLEAMSWALELHQQALDAARTFGIRPPASGRAGARTALSAWADTEPYPPPSARYSERAAPDAHAAAGC